jgi:S1-C subfamily serine protease
MKTSIIPILWIACLANASNAAVYPAQDEPPPLRSPEEKQAVDAQTDEFNQSLTPALTDAAKSTVRIWSGRHRLSYGTVFGDGHRILTKWSEVARAAGNLHIESANGEVVAASIAGVYNDEDLAVLEFTGTALTPVKWSAETPKLGSFLAASQPNGRPAGFGVVSVPDRNLRDTDQAYLGVIGTLGYNGPGVKIQDIAADSGAAAAELKPGDVILKVGERPISGVLELRNSLINVKPGNKVKLLVLANDQEKSIEILLGNRPNLPKFPGDRLQQMEQMGGPISRVHDSFSRVIQSDMRLQPDQVGGPVVDLKGRVIGVSLARSGRTSSYVMPAPAVENLLKKQPENPSLVTTRQDSQLTEQPNRALVPDNRMMPGNRERMRHHMEEMQRLMDFMREEMEGLQPER